MSVGSRFALQVVKCVVGLGFLLVFTCFLALTRTVQSQLNIVIKDLKSVDAFSFRNLDRLIQDTGKTKFDEEIDIDNVLQEINEQKALWNKKAQEISTKVEPKTILYWNSAYGSTKYGFCCGRQPFLDFQCPVNNCFATDDRKYLEDVSDFDAVLFHQRSLYSNDLPEKRNPEQRYIMFMIESPANLYGFQGEEWSGFFNWTMTYRQDSDIPLPYGDIAPIKTLPENIPEYIQAFGRKNAERFSNKIKGGNTEPRVAWFVSNCDSSNEREKYVAKLKQYVKVDVYGGCGDHKCSRDNETACWKMADDTYHFYLALENSNCKDYVTEKFFNVLSRTSSVIPVAIGGANYAGIAPEKSHLVISRTSLEDPRELAVTMRRIVSSAAKFAEYFWWKDFYEVRQDAGFRAKAFCDLCAKLHSDSGRKRVYEDIEDWWVRKGKCRRARIKE